MSAQVLLQAAALMRERAERAQASGDGEPWFPVEELQGLIGGGSRNTADAEHIAALSPVVALAVADWLDEQATAYRFNESAWTAGAADPKNRWAERGLTVEGNLAHHHRLALAVARTYLGGAA